MGGGWVVVGLLLGLGYCRGGWLLGGLVRWLFVGLLLGWLVVGVGRWLFAMNGWLGGCWGGWL